MDVSNILFIKQLCPNDFCWYLYLVGCYISFWLVIFMFPVDKDNISDLMFILLRVFSAFAFAIMSWLSVLIIGIIYLIIRNLFCSSKPKITS